MLYNSFVIFCVMCRYCFETYGVAMHTTHSLYLVYAMLCFSDFSEYDFIAIGILNACYKLDSETELSVVLAVP